MDTISHLVIHHNVDIRASTPLRAGGKCLVEKVEGSKKLKTGGNIFSGKLPRNAWHRM